MKSLYFYFLQNHAPEGILGHFVVFPQKYSADVPEAKLLFPYHEICLKMMLH